MTERKAADYSIIEDNKIKVYVDVKARFTREGTMLPFEITWENGVRYRIDRVKDIKRAAPLKAGGTGDRYTIVVRGQQSFIWFERSAALSGTNIGRWFVERRVPAQIPSAD